MPKASVHEDDRLCRRDDKIRLSSQRLDVPTIADPHLSQQPRDLVFRARPRAFDSRHDLAALSFGIDVRHHNLGLDGQVERQVADVPQSPPLHHLLEQFTRAAGINFLHGFSKLLECRMIGTVQVARSKGD